MVQHQRNDEFRSRDMKRRQFLELAFLGAAVFPPSRAGESMMSESLRCRCPSCAAKYRFPAEAVGRRARCRECGVAFRVPMLEPNSLEDSVIMWLDEAEAATPVSNRPRIITAKDLHREGTPTGPRRPIPLKQHVEKEAKEKQGK